jgi:hypothetical protein
MKIAANNYTNEAFGMAAEGNFTFQASAQAFHIVMSGIAKDKIRYPVREVCTNAWDAARGDVEVTLPTWLDPTFKVRDYGAGLTHEQIRDVYTSMFASSKNNSNDEVGGMGLGCKSPFAYLTAGGQAGSFNVTSYQGGHARFYLMSLGSDGKPKWQMLGTSSTHERDGLEVSFAVRHEDFYRFQDAAHEILWAFEPRPRVKNMSEAWVTNPKVLRSGEGWKEYDRTHVPFRGPHIRMGCVYYPLSMAQLDRSDWPWAQQSILFETEIGSLSVTASREELSYDDRTITTLKARVEQMEKEFLTALQVKLDAEDTLPGALAVLYHDDSINVGGTLRGYLKKSLLWKGRPIKTIKSWSRDRLGKNTFTYSTNVTNWKFEQGGGNKPNSEFNLYSMLLDGLNPPKFVFERIPKFSTLKLKTAEAAGLIADGDNIIWLRPRDEGIIEQVAEFLHMEVSEMIDLDALLPSQKRNKRAPTDPVYRNLHVLTATMIREGEAIDITLGGKYIVRSENKVRHPRRAYEYALYHFGLGDTRTWRDTLNSFPKITLPRIVLATEHQEKQLKKYGDWQRYTIEELLAEMEKHINFASVLDATSAKALNYSISHALEMIHMSENLFPDDIIDLSNKYHVMKMALDSPDQSNTERYNLYRNLGGTQEAKSVSTLNEETTTAFAAAEAKYPAFTSILEAISNRRYHAEPKIGALATYLKLFDAQHKA